MSAVPFSSVFGDADSQQTNQSQNPPAQPQPQQQQPVSFSSVFGQPQNAQPQQPSPQAIPLSAVMGQPRRQSPQQTPFDNPLQKLFPTSPLAANGLLSQAVQNARGQIRQAVVAPAGLPADAMTLTQLPYYQSQAIGATNQRAQQAQDIAQAQQIAAANVAQDAATHPITGRLEELGKGTTGAIQSGLARLYSQVNPQAGQAMQQGIQVQNPAVGAAGKTGAVLGSLELPVAASVINPIAGISELAAEGAGGARQEVAGLREQGKQISGAQEAGQALLQGGIQGGAGAAFGQLGKLVGDIFSSLGPELATGEPSAFAKATQMMLSATGKSVGGAVVNHAATVASNLVRRGVDPSTALQQGWIQNDLIGAVLPHAFEAGGHGASGEEAPMANAGEPQSATMPQSAPTPKVAPERAGSANFEPQTPTVEQPSAITKAVPAQPVQPASTPVEVTEPAIEPNRPAEIPVNEKPVSEGQTGAATERPKQLTFMDALLANKAAKEQEQPAAISGEPVPGELEHANRIAQQEHGEAGISNRHKGSVALPDVNFGALQSDLSNAVKGIKSTPGKSAEATGHVVNALKAIFPVESDTFAKTFGSGKSNMNFEDAKNYLRAASIEAANEHSGAMKILESTRRAFETMPEDERIEFMRGMYDNQPQRNPALQDIARTMYEISNQRRQQLVSLGVDAARDWQTEHWSQLWRNPEKVLPQALLGRIGGAGKLGGITGAGLLKPRSLDWFDDGIQAGHEPVTSNPLEMFKMVDASQRKYIGMASALQNMEAIGSIYRGEKPIDPSHSDITALIPAGLRKLVGDSEEGEKFYADPQVAQLIKNVMDISAFQRGPVRKMAFNTVRFLNNAMTRLSLLLSPFYHIGKVFGIEGPAIRISEGLNPLQHIGEGLVNTERGRTIQASMEGLASMLDPNSRKIVDAMKSQLLAEHDPLWNLGNAKDLAQAWHDHDIYGLGKNIVTSKFVFDAVQRSKLCLGFDIMGKFLRDNPQAEETELASEASRVADKLDSLVGLLSRDRMLMNRTMRDALGLSTFSFGWNAGTAQAAARGIGEAIGLGREFASKAAGQLGAGNEAIAAIKGQGANGAKNLKYWLASGAMMALYGTLKTLYNTHRLPNSTTDVIAPPTNRKRPDGSDERESLPFYWNDLLNFTRSSAHTIANKASPIVSLASDLMTNKTFDGRQVWNPIDDRKTQAKQIASYLAQNHVEPIAAKNFLHFWDESHTPYEKARAIFDAFTMRLAPVSAGQSTAEQLATELEQEHRSGKSPEVGALDDQKSAWRAKIEQNPSDQDTLNQIMDAVHNYKLSQTEANSLYKEASMAKQFPGIAGVPLHSDLQADDLLKIWNAASDEERSKMLPTLNYRLRKISAKTATDFGTWIDLARTAAAFQQNHPQTATAPQDQQ